jgi:hypothetical protein
MNRTKEEKLRKQIFQNWLDLQFNNPDGITASEEEIEYIETLVDRPKAKTLKAIKIKALPPIKGKLTREELSNELFKLICIKMGNEEFTNKEFKEKCSLKADRLYDAWINNTKHRKEHRVGNYFHPHSLCDWMDRINRNLNMLVDSGKLKRREEVIGQRKQSNRRGGKRVIQTIRQHFSIK